MDFWFGHLIERVLFPYVATDFEEPGADLVAVAPIHDEPVVLQRSEVVEHCACREVKVVSEFRDAGAFEVAERLNNGHRCLYRADGRVLFWHICCFHPNSYSRSVDGGIVVWGTLIFARNTAGWECVLMPCREPVLPA